MTNQNVPPNKNFYKLKQDTREESIRHYTITVVTSLTTENFEVTHRIYNEWEGIRSFISNYYS